MNAAVTSITKADWFPVLTLVLGFLLKLLSDRFQHRENRRDVLATQRRNFQRETLIGLQEAVVESMSAAARAFNEDEIEYEKCGRWRRSPLSKELNEPFFAAMRRTALLLERVHNAGLRRLVTMFHNHGAEQIQCVSRETCKDIITKMGVEFALIQERIGELLRTLDDEKPVVT